MSDVHETNRNVVAQNSQLKNQVSKLEGELKEMKDIMIQVAKRVGKGKDE